jgi:anti-sigma factor RsiW
VSAPLDCKALVELVSHYIEGVLPDDDRVRFDKHLEGCPFCARYVEQMRKTIALTGRLREQDIAPEARERLLSAFRDWRARPT